MNEEMNALEKALGCLTPQHKIEGFDPNDLLTKVQTVDENGQPVDFLYMEFQASMQWFLTVFPNGCFDFRYDAVNNEQATVTALVYRRPEDARFASKATATRFYSDDSYGRNYRQNAETAAIRKALERLGFGIPIDAHETSATRIINERDKVMRSEIEESGVMLPRPAMPTVKGANEKTDGDGIHTPVPVLVGALNQGELDMDAAEHPAESEQETVNKEQPAKPTPSRRGRPRKAAAPKNTEAQNEGTPDNGTENKRVEDKQSSSNENLRPAAPSAAENAAKTATVEPARRISTPFNSSNQFGNATPTLEQARNFKVPFGTYAGKTLEQAITESPKGAELILMYERYAKSNPDFAKALSVYKSQMLV